MWYAGAMAVGLALFAVVSFLIIRQEIERRADRLLDEVTQAFGAELQLEYRMLGSREQAIDETLRGVRFRGVTLGVLDSANQGGIASLADSSEQPPALTSSREATRAEIERALPLVRAAMADSNTRLIIPADNPAGILVHIAPVALGDGSNAIVVAARSRNDDREALRHAALVFVSLMLVSLMVVAVGGYALTQQTLAPIASMRQQAQAISAKDLSARVPVGNPDDELGALALVINDLLQRLERAFDMQRHFVADASHELRTPVSIIRNEASVSLAHASRTDTEFRDAMEIVSQESVRLTSLVEDLFLLARADAGGQSLQPEPMYLADMMRDVAQATRTLANRRQLNVHIQSDDDGAYSGDHVMLRRALLNLVDNAIKYSNENGDVTMSLTSTATHWHVRVMDTGSGIPSADQQKVFDRFFRGDSARTRVRQSATSGAGLGLAIAHYIAVAHGGQLAIERSDHRGTVFLLSLPHAPPAN